MPRILFALVLLLAMLPAPSAAALVGYSYSGGSTFVFSAPFSQPFVTGMSVTGHFIFDPATGSNPPDVLALTGMARYLQDIPNGFTATFRNLITSEEIHVSASKYFVGITNNSLVDGKDYLSVMLRTDTGWIPGAKLKVGASEFSTARFTLDFTASSPSVFTSNALPSQLPSEFTSGPVSSIFNSLGDGPSLAAGDLIFGITSLTQFEVATVPESSTASLLIVAAVISIVVLREKQRTAMD